MKFGIKTSTTESFLGSCPEVTSYQLNHKRARWANLQKPTLENSPIDGIENTLKIQLLYLRVKFSAMRA
jgi:hypothetical protein